MKIKYADVRIIRPDIMNESIGYIIPNKHFSSKEKAGNYLRKKFGLKNFAVLDFDNCICEHEITEGELKEYLEGENND